MQSILPHYVFISACILVKLRVHVFLCMQFIKPHTYRHYDAVNFISYYINDSCIKLYLHGTCVQWPPLVDLSYEYFSEQ